VLLAVITWQVAVDGPLLSADAQLATALRHNAPPTFVAELFADLGNPGVALPVLVAAMAYTAVTARVRRWLPPLCALLPVVGAVLVVSILKVWLGRPGPLGGINYYPSGHTAMAAVAFGGAALLLSLSVPGPPYWPLPATAACLTLLCSAGLIWRGYHWPLDVLASWCLGWVLLVSATALVRRGLGHGGRGQPNS
jgi:membrane-associated phospholipid phosphatase